MDDLGWLEMESNSSIGALCDVLADVFRGGIWRVRPLTKVHQMCIEEVWEVQRLGDIRSRIVNQIVEISLEVVEQIAKDSTIAVGGIKETRVTKSRDVQLNFGQSRTHMIPSPMLTVNKSAFWRKDLLEPANRQRIERTKAVVAQASVKSDESRMLDIGEWSKIGYV